MTDKPKLTGGNIVDPGHETELTEEAEIVFNCNHDRAFAPWILTSDPPQQQWICRSCLEEGVEILGSRSPIQLENYESAKSRKADMAASKQQPIENAWSPQGGD